jgi:hypothetical protein
MKKLFLSLMLVAAFAMSFVSCDKKTTESETHSQTFTLGETSFAIDNAITIENIQYQGSDVYSAIVLSQGKMIGNNSGEGKGVVIVFHGDITAGTHNLAFNPLYPTANFPMYFVAELQVDDIVNFSLENLMEQEGVFVGTSGSFTLAMDGNVYTLTTEGIEVKKIKDLSVIEPSSVDYEGGVDRYVLATVVEGNFNGTNIVTAGTTKYTIAIVQANFAAFITESADMIALISGNSIPVGTFTYEDYPIMYIPTMNTANAVRATGGEGTISKDGDYYTIDMTGLVFDGMVGTSALHYVGTMPYFDFPF